MSLTVLRRSVCAGFALVFSLSAPAAEARTLAAIRASGVLKVGLTGDYAPYALGDADGTITGADVAWHRRWPKSLASPWRSYRQASHGIGKAVATKFAAEGHPLLLVARHPEPLDGVPAKQVRQAAVDVADYAALESAIRDAEAVFGPTECLVNNAGFLKIGPLEERNVAEMSYEVDVLFKGVLNGIRAVLAGMKARRSGTIINVSSIGDRAAGPDGEVYHASKAAVRSLSASLQKGEAANNIRVINIAPGFVKTSIPRRHGHQFSSVLRAARQS
jgi:NADP-dependent 3-hydroxy acid dehydrogenase YdfG